MSVDRERLSDLLHPSWVGEGHETDAEFEGLVEIVAQAIENGTIERLGRADYTPISGPDHAFHAGLFVGFLSRKVESIRIIDDPDKNHTATFVIEDDDLLMGRARLSLHDPNL